jgi:hypothetical protein
MGGPTRFGPGLKIPGKKWGTKSRPGPVRALGLSGRPGFFYKKNIFKAVVEGYY